MSLPVRRATALDAKSVLSRLAAQIYSPGASSELAEEEAKYTHRKK